MAWSLLTEPWLPVRKADGSRARIPLHQISDPDVVDISHDRPDTTGAARELVIGLLQALYPPADSEERNARIISPPSAEDLSLAFVGKEGMFELIEGPSRFLQDHGGVPTEDIRPIDSLMLNGPGDNTRTLHRDLFVRRDMVTEVCPSCVVLLLASKQYYASASGAGFRVSPRGGGPLTTLVEFVADDGGHAPLWPSLYANVIPLSVFGGRGLTDENSTRVLPWLASLRISKFGKSDISTTLEHADPLQVFFPAACRIEVVWKKGDKPCECHVCGSLSDVMAVAWKTAQYGVKYLGLIHPLTPYRQDKDSGLLSLKPKGFGVSYFDWVAVTFGSEGSGAPSLNVQQMKDSIHDLGFTARIRAYGYQLDKSAALAWHEAVIPFVDVPQYLRHDFVLETARMVDTAREVASSLVWHVKQALYERPKDVSGDLSHIRGEFISSTTNSFYQILPNIVAALESETITDIKREWLDVLRKQALVLFDRHAPVHIVEERNLERLIKTHRKFRALLYSKWIMAQMDLPVVKRDAA